VSRTEPLVSIGLPVRNGEQTVGRAIRTVLDQDYTHLELVISDNASDDGTEEICRELARSDTRIRYIRQPENIGLIPNFYAVLHRGRGTYFKWMGHDDWLAPAFVRRCVEVLDDDQSLILVTTRQGHVGAGGEIESASYGRNGLQSADPVERFRDMLRIYNDSLLLLDPLYGMIRPGPVAGLPRPVMLYEDQVFAGRLALAGPFGHIDEVLSYRLPAPYVTRAAIARRLGVPTWQVHIANLLMCRELWTVVGEAGLPRRERRAARAAIAPFFLRRQQMTMAHRARRVAGLVSDIPARMLAGLSRPRAADADARRCSRTVAPAPSADP
jgi:glycosyltransferase involved in cell wall biosynthesis